MVTMRPNGYASRDPVDVDMLAQAWLKVQPLAREALGVERQHEVLHRAAGRSVILDSFNRHEAAALRFHWHAGSVDGRDALCGDDSDLSSSSWCENAQDR